MRELSELIDDNELLEPRTHSDCADVVNLLLSLDDGRSIASRQRNLVELANTFLGVERRLRFAKLCSRAASVAAPELLRNAATSSKLRKAMEGQQETARDTIGRVAAKLFPEMFRPHQGRDLLRHHAAAS